MFGNETFQLAHFDILHNLLFIIYCLQHIVYWFESWFMELNQKLAKSFRKIISQQNEPIDKRVFYYQIEFYFNNHSWVLNECIVLHAGLHSTQENRMNKTP